MISKAVLHYSLTNYLAWRSTIYYTIYQTINNINTKDYWGAHKTSDINDTYLGSGSAINGSINKYGRDNFTKLVTGVFVSEKIMYWIEEMVVDEEMVKDPNNYNRKVGGKGGWGLVNTPEIQKKAKAKKREFLDSLTPAESKQRYSRGEGSDNPLSKQINIYNKEGELQYKTHGDFRKICKENNLPFEKLQHTYQNKCESIYTNMRACDYTRVVNRFGKERIDYLTGWYAQIVPAYK